MASKLVRTGSRGVSFSATSTEGYFCICRVFVLRLLIFFLAIRRRSLQQVLQRLPVLQRAAELHDPGGRPHGHGKGRDLCVRYHVRRTSAVSFLLRRLYYTINCSTIVFVLTVSSCRSIDWVRVCRVIPSFAGRRTSQLQRRARQRCTG